MTPSDFDDEPTLEYALPELDDQRYHVGEKWVSQNGVTWYRASSEEGRRIQAEWDAERAAAGGGMVCTAIERARGVITFGYADDEDGQ